jgi:Family of unknown function (DUF5989)
MRGRPECAALVRAHHRRCGFFQAIAFRSYIAMNFIRDAKSRLSIFGELWAFMRVRKKWWLGPIMIFLLLLGVLIVFTEGSALAPFIYALF